MTRIMTSLRMLVALSLLTGLAYPLLMLATGAALFPMQAGGSLLRRDGVVIGSAFVAQKFSGANYFHPRPSAADYATVPSGASNLSPTSEVLLELTAERRAALEKSSGREMLFASGSGLDPDITPESALAQVPRIAAARGFSRDAVVRLVHSLTQPRDFGFLGQERVNVLRLNVTLDELEHFNF